MENLRRRFGIARPSVQDDVPEEKRYSSTIKPLGPEHYGRIEEQLGYHFENIDWLQRALTHRSAPGSQGSQNDYERLEFLGDAVLDLVVAHLLLDEHPDVKEGELSKMRAALVNTTSLADIARRVKLGRFIKLSRGELANGGADRPSILADVFEAVIGAVYREGGYAKAFEAVKTLFGDMISTVTPTDPKTELQEALHAAGSEAPTYLLECVEGPEHAPVFISVVEVDKQIVGRGKGPTKKASQQAAAAQALERLLKEDDIDRVFLVLNPVSESEAESRSEP